MSLLRIEACGYKCQIGGSGWVAAMTVAMAMAMASASPEIGQFSLLLLTGLVLLGGKVVTCPRRDPITTAGNQKYTKKKK